MLEDLNIRMKQLQRGCITPLDVINYIFEEMDKDIQIKADKLNIPFSHMLGKGGARNIQDASSLIHDKCMIIVEELLNFITERNLK